MDVAVVPMDRERLVRGQTVVVRGDRIAQVGPTATVLIPAGARRIDGKGKYLLPGLVDMHVHMRNIGDLLLHLAHGVTTLRIMQGFAYHLRWRDSIAAGTLLGPALYVASNLIEGDSAFSEGSLVVRTAHGAARTVAAIAREGYDFVKVYVSLEPVAYDGVVQAARRRALRTVGHVPWRTGMHHALAMKQASIEHAENIYQTWFGSRTDTAGLAAMARATRDAGVAVCPTLTTFRSVVLNARAAAVLDSLSARPEWRYVEPSVLASWQEEARAFPEQNGSSQADLLRRFEGEYAFFKRIVQALKAAGVTILAGTDAPSNFELPGEQLIHELQVYQEIGFSPFQALVSATSDAARFLDPHRSFGILAAGQRADLLLLHANPLRDVGNLAARAGVMVGGHWWSDAELRTALERFATIYASARWRPEGYEPGDYERLQARLAEELAALAPAGRPERSGSHWHPCCGSRIGGLPH